MIGEAIRESDDLFGSGVDAAARIMARAEGDQILVSEILKAALGAARDLDFRRGGRAMDAVRCDPTAVGTSVVVSKAWASRR